MSGPRYVIKKNNHKFIYYLFIYSKSGDDIKMDENDKIELIKILEDEELAEKIWQGWIELQNDPVWQKNTSGKTSVDLIGR